MKKIMTAIEMEESFEELTDFVNKKIIHNNNDSIIAEAPVKCGKKNMVEYYASKNISTDTEEKHIFLTVLDRKDIKIQQSELELYGIKPFVVSRNTIKNNCLQQLDEYALKFKKIVAHVDESDFGTGDEQLLSQVYEKLLDVGAKIILYSATNEEAILSDTGINSDVVEFVPPNNYRGASWYLDNNLVFEPKPFVSKDFEITQHGIELCENFSKSNKTFGILRVPVLEKTETEKDRKKLLEKQNKQRKSFASFLNKKFGIHVRFIDKDNAFDWSKDGDHETLSGKWILVITQTCTRSTEVGFHDRIDFWHDYRETSSYGTLNQAYLRVAHYVLNPKSGLGYPEGSVNIKCFMDKNVFLLAAKRITKEKFIENTKWPLSSRVSHQKRTKCIYHWVNKREDCPQELLPTSLGGTIPDNIMRKKRGGGMATVSGTKVEGDAADCIMNNKKLNAGARGMVIHVDGECNQYPNSWNSIKNHPEYQAGKRWVWREDLTDVEINDVQTTNRSMYQITQTIN